MGADVRAIVFGRGSTKFATDHGLTPLRAASPSQIVEAFTDAFRGIVQAPYKVHRSLAAQPTFEMKRWIDEAWVVVYGDATLGGVQLETPNGVLEAKFAEDDWKPAGAYKVAYLKSPPPGIYKVRATAGGNGVTYGVVQRSSLQLHYSGPQKATSGVPVRIVAGIRAIADGPEIPESEFGEKAQLRAVYEGQTVVLTDDGTNGDEKAGDGRYSAMITPQTPGTIGLRIEAHTSFLDRRIDAQLVVAGQFRCRRCEETVRFGDVKAGSAPVCRALALDAEHVGSVPFQLQLRQSLPRGLQLQLSGAGPGGVLTRDPNSPPLRLCLEATRHAGASQLAGEPIASLGVSGSSSPTAQVTLRVHWNVQPLSFWTRWGWLILSLLGLVVLAWIIYGYIRPQRFARELAVCYAPGYVDLDEQTPQPLKLWRDVRIGFYRNARAYFLPDFRITGKKSGAIAMLEAGPKRSAIAFPAGGQSLFRETADGDWEVVPSTGRRVMGSEVYRVADKGPYFRISARLLR
ncbi:MAG: hypothetical protein JNK87_25820 [Bryobacterales bacterium]|nr:hypothetical protein [Bryobacterales bacterium]